MITFRTRLLLILMFSVAASVLVVEAVVLSSARRAFESLESQRTDALVVQFRREFDRRGEEVFQAVSGIAASDAAVSIAMAQDYSAYHGEAATLAAARNLELLELVAQDGSIVDSAQSPARWGYREDWLAEGAWQTGRAFLRREELPDGFTLALVAVAKTTVGDRKLYVAGGKRLDAEFLSTLALPGGMRALLYRNLDAGFNPANLVEAAAAAAAPAQAALLRPLIDRVRANKLEASALLGSGANAETFHALPLKGPDGELLGVLLIGNSRRELAQLEAVLRGTAIAVAFGGALAAVALAWWATARITKPVRKLAETAQRVAAGNWSATVDAASADEIGQLARAFNNMTGELAAQRERLVQAERVAAWRELARRLAHELKNPLFPLQITVENMRRARECAPEQFDEVFQESSTTLLAELSNLKQIIGRFSDFAKMPAPQMEPVNLNALASEALKLLDPQLAAAHVETRLELDPALRPLQADPEQITRVIRNLSLNAIDAMPKGGALTIRTQALPAGARLEVSDTGQGLTPEECERLFTPYYTTKTHGTGLGLAIVQSVVADHGGRISVASQPGQGATFRIELGA
jgi:two-component system, NtrC family, nitrogen regulation sensor histidine kinase NtrY